MHGRAGEPGRVAVIDLDSEREYVLSQVRLSARCRRGCKCGCKCRYVGVGVDMGMPVCRD